ncbi:MAG: hypothetical protein II773_03995 [Oscillospiraceae bacterium]|nr:hypothetical protein [Oscillospiraceae bacterium]
MKKTKRRILTVCIISAVLIAAAVIWFRIPYSPLRSDFESDIERLTADSRCKYSNDILGEDDIAELPPLLQDYLKTCGYIGTPCMSYMKMEYHDVAFRQGREGPSLRIDYTLYGIAAEPCRMAFIDSWMFGIPFQGYDYYENGTGGMKGVLAKAITLFDERGDDMDRACLVTYLSECMFLPAILLDDDISFEQTDDNHVRAEITYAGQTAGGIFTFNDDNEMISFESDDRGEVPWTAKCSGYVISESGIKHPTDMQAVWNYPDGDFIYFDGKIGSIIYG